MKKRSYKYERRFLFTVFLLLTGIFIGRYQPYDGIQWVTTRTVQAEERWNVAGSTITTESEKVSKLQTIFAKYNSPLASQAAFLVDLSNKYQIDYRLLPAIAFSESSLCKHYILSTNNCFGWGPNHHFSSMEEAEETVVTGITTLSYYKKWQADKNDVSKLGHAYNPSDGTEYWIKKVAGFMKEVER